MEEKYTTVITAKNKLFDINIKELFRYRDLILLFVRRTFVAQYKQTILGPAWAVIQPLFTTIVFNLVFGNLAGLAPGGVPSFLFYLSGTVMWTYFNGCLTNTANTFILNSNIMGKVYFPRLVMPISTVLSQLIAFAIQFVMFIVAYLLFALNPKYSLSLNWSVVLVPLLVLQMALLGLGLGIIISSLTTKYRDLAMLVTFVMQLWMYLTPVTYSSEIIPSQLRGLYMLNPMTPIIETTRYAFLGTQAGVFDVTYYLISWVVTIVLFVLGVILFNRVEKTFMDTI